MADLWGRCATCERWFRCDDWLDHRQPAAGCPTCGDEPSELLNLAAAIGARVVIADAGEPATLR